MECLELLIKTFGELTDLTRNIQLDQSNNKTIKIDIREITLISKTTSDGLLRISTRGVSILCTSISIFTINLSCVWHGIGIKYTFRFGGSVFRCSSGGLLTCVITIRFNNWI